MKDPITAAASVAERRTATRRRHPARARSLVAASALGGLCALLAAAPSQATTVGYVYTNEDDTVNSVGAFAVDDTGALTALAGSPFPTGGSGGHGGFFAANRARIRTSAATRTLYVTNRPSGTISGFAIGAGGGLTPLPGSPYATTVASPGSIAVDPTGSCLFVTDDGGAGIARFSLAPTGEPTLLGVDPGSGGTMDSTEISPDGAYIVTALVSTHGLDVRALGAGCTLTPVAGSPFPAVGGDAVAGLAFDESGTLLFGGAANFGSTIVAVFDFAAGVPTAIAGSPFVFGGLGSNSNVVLLAPGGDRLFASNQASNTIASLAIDPFGVPTAVPGGPYATGILSAPAGLAITPDGSILLTGGVSNQLSALLVQPDGSLVLGPGSPVPTGTSSFGLESIAFVPAAVCGNGLVEPGEACDEGADNGTFGSCCSASCSAATAGTACRNAAGACDVAEACDGTSVVCPADAVVGAGIECRGAAGECDVAEACDGSSVDCPPDAFVPAGNGCTPDSDACTFDQCDGSGTCAHPAKPDADADGTCDEQDACTNVGGGQDFASAPKSTVGLTKINTDTTAGNDGLKISAEFQLGAGESFAGLNPLAQGARVLIRTAGAVVRLDQALPGGGYAGKGTRGWALNKAGNGWTYSDSTAAPLSGIKRLKIGDRSKKAPRRVKVVVTGAHGTYPVVSGDAPIEAIVVLGDQAAATAGACGESAYSPAQCAFNGKGDALRCK